MKFLKLNNRIEEHSYRYELKYIISLREYHLLKPLLENVMILDENSIEDCKYSVRSMYFDTLDDLDYKDKMYGIEKRKKVRIRIYNLDDSLIKIEIKSKRNNLMCKEIMKTDRALLDNIINNQYNKFLDIDNEMSKKLYLYFSLNKVDPKVIIEYQREAYYYPFSNIRVNFDMNIKANFYNKNIFDNNLNFIPIADNNSIVLELKFREFVPTWLKDILSSIKMNRSTFSKYCIAREIQRGE